ncbi:MULTISPECIES: CYTH domain-containing protein [Kitasatospora]|uniref:CYTH domain-containing protein n=1 Tax=Kitasatospora TaxID=2063 RepID=UPI00068F0A1D|nr:MULTISPECIES: CYTH domain-containing protein [unclassified Kitasatospora]WAL73680.1 CYTH domain-containing protein [Kitasatospora sp. YST-16]WNW39740.1 CYTH domain-containing protein [Streptomyces sp. Li-HN-5-13]
MGVEIERKFLVPEGEHVPDGREFEVRQGYLVLGPEGAEARVRRQGEECSLTVKRGTGLVRGEWETPLSAEQFADLWPATEHARIDKTRRVVPLGPHEAVVDTYRGRLAGLRTAEVEFTDPDAAAAFTPPPWFGPEVTDRPDLKNRHLATADAPPLT